MMMMMIDDDERRTPGGIRVLRCVLDQRGGVIVASFDPLCVSHVFAVLCGKGGLTVTKTRSEPCKQFPTVDSLADCFSDGTPVF